MNVIIHAVVAFFVLFAIGTAAESDASSFCTVGPVSDARFEAVRDTDTLCDCNYVPKTYRSQKAWYARAKELRLQILASAGLAPMPKKTSLQVKVFGTVDGGDYTVEKVYFQSYPGLFVTGNLYRPKGDGPYPAVLNPHGHWPNGRFENSEAASIPGRCINFAKQGYVAFSYDMIGFGDSWQIAHSAYPEITYGNERTILNGRDADLTRDVIGYRRDHKLWGISVGGLQLWNSIRAVDFVESLPFVDKGRIACTSASGGATQTFLLAAVDDRVKVVAPVNMISTESQGGCLCETLPGLRLDTNNVEFACLIAPRPLVLVSATGDWTKNFPTLGFPAVRHIYGLFGAEEKVSVAQFTADHNYNKDSREAVYSWFGKWLPQSPLPQPVKEKPFEVESVDALRVCPVMEPPKGALAKDDLVAELREMFQSQLEACRPTNSGKLAQLRKTFLPTLRSALSMHTKPDVRAEERGKETLTDCTVTRLVLKDRTRGAQIPAFMFVPKSERRGEAVLLIDEKGKQGHLVSSADAPGSLVRSLLKSGRTVCLVDCFGTGEHTAPEGSPKRDLDFYQFDTYNRTDTAERVYDIIVAIGYLKRNQGSKRLDLVGSGRAGLWCLLARPFAGYIKRTVADAAGLDISSDAVFPDDLYVPGLRRAGDFRTAVAVAAPAALYLHNTQGLWDSAWVEDAYESAGATAALQVSEQQASDDKIAAWLTRK
ncbi:MAG: acetylxylan esterase [Armatimonadetes bacterium]|nr:acetylxylan esterase [Armatimonadota bacterium]